MLNNTVQINGAIEFYVDDSRMNVLLSLLRDIGTPVIECPECGEDIWPQVENRYYNDPIEEFHVICGACDADVVIRPVSLGS